MAENITLISGKHLDILPPESQETVKNFFEKFDLSTYTVTGGNWNQSPEDLQEETGIIGNYIVVGQPYKDSQQNTRTPQRFYRLNANGSVEIVDDEVVIGPDGNFLGYASQTGIKSIHKEKSPNLNVAGTLVKNNKGDITGLSFLRAAPKGEKLDLNLSSLQNITFKK